jgi:outer membrane protein
VIYKIETAYYLLLNAIGQEQAAHANLANANAVQQAAESSLKNGLATLPDVLEARSAVAEAIYNVQAAIGAEDVARAWAARFRRLARDYERLSDTLAGFTLLNQS